MNEFDHTLMASLQIEVASSSSPFSYSLRDHNRSTNIKDYIHSQCILKNKADDDQDNDSDSSWLPSQNSKTKNHDSWLPTSTVTSESDCSHHRKGQDEVDDSWLPTTKETGRKCRTNAYESKNDIDYSWLPSTFSDNHQKKHKNDSINDKNKNRNKNKSKSKNSDSKSNNNNSSNNNSNSRTQKKSGNDHWALAREVVFSCDQHYQNKELSRKTLGCSKKQDSPSKARYMVESPTSGGVSSLLQRWRDLAEAKSSNKNGNVSPLTNRNNVGSTCKENNPSSDGFTKNRNPSQQSPPNISKDSDADWETDKAGRPRRLSCPLPSRESRDIKDSNTIDAEKEKIRVVDIIKKLSREEELAASGKGGNGNESLPPIRTSLDHRQMEGEQKCFKGVRVSHHLIRGRQAFNNFLMQMEHDKHHELKWLVERKAVSKFSQRGRIQALLRFRILRLGAEPKPEDKRHKRCISKTLELNNRLDIMDLKERFNSRVEKGVAESRKEKRNLIKNTANEETSSTPIAAKEVDFKTKTKMKATSSINITAKNEPRSKQEPMTPNQSTSSCKDVVHKAKGVDSSSKYPIMHKVEAAYKDDDKYDFHEDEGQFMSAKTSYSHIEDKGMSDLEETNNIDKKQGLESFEDWMTGEYSQTRSDLDEDESYDMQLFDSNYDWISCISRPKSDWEDMRQARYQEMLNHSSRNADIRRLLERKSVSSFLSSSFRDLIDQLMMSRIQQSHVQVENQEVAMREKDKPRKEEVELEDGSMVDEYGDCRSINDKERPCSEYCETPCSEQSWRPNDGVYSSETTTTTTTSPSLDCSLSSNRSPNNNTPQSSSGVTHHSIEMELIYDLKGHMKKLHQEIMELRKSIKCCVNMQIKMQRSFKQNDAIAPATRPVPKKERKPLDVGRNDCFICSDKQVDSLLYRCGHMCTCFICAVELQRTSRECPVCKAPIVDVVKAFAQEN